MPVLFYAIRRKLPEDFKHPNSLQDRKRRRLPLNRHVINLAHGCKVEPAGFAPALHTQRLRRQGYEVLRGYILLLDKKKGPASCRALFYLVAGEHFEKYWTEENLMFETVELGK